jgi:hypothetical protein
MILLKCITAFAGNQQTSGQASIAMIVGIKSGMKIELEINLKTLG